MYWNKTGKSFKVIFMKMLLSAGIVVMSFLQFMNIFEQIASTLGSGMVKLNAWKKRLTQ